jgi:hypothetical protein
MPLQLMVAAIAGVGLAVLVGTGLMAVVLLGSRAGDDADAAKGGRDDRR